ncbi:DUF882 domain-containing protein [Ahrensia kielensis]|uniref:Murein endopeptidase K n=1 Tax=Ahrensia kielensis TaxID=76980 RepID=A0ABU9T7Q3_9HYPH
MIFDNKFKNQISCNSGRSFLARFIAVFTISVLASVSFAVEASAETRSLKLYYIHTKEKENIVFKKNGRYVSSGLTKINRFLRDWRRNEPTKMDPALLDLVWEAYRASGSREYIHVVSAYRSPATNAMLRKTRGGQATKSQHMLGKAMDFYIPGVPVKKLREIGFKLGGGGVGYYPRSGVPFVHLDTGNVRAWPRMSRSELTRLFPRGGTLHLPPDGKPLPGYNKALADYKAGKRNGGGPVIEDKKRSGGNLLTALFGGRDEEEDNEETTVAAPQAPARAKAATRPADTPGTLLASLPTRSLPVPSSAPRNRATESAVPVAISAPVAAPIPAPAPTPVPQVEIASAPELPTYQIPVPSSRPTVLIARAEPPVDRQSAQDLENALARANQAPQAQPQAPDGNVAIAAAINSNVEATPEQEQTELAYAIPIPTPAPQRAVRETVELASLPTPKPLERATSNETSPTETIAAYAPPDRGITIPAATVPQTPVAASPAPTKPAAEPVANKPAETLVASLNVSDQTSSTAKGSRPTAKDIASTAAPAAKIIPVEDIDKSRFGSWTTASASITQEGRASERPDFIQNATRAVPNVVYTSGFSKDPPPNTNSFSGNAVTFLAVAKFEGNGGEGRGEPLQIRVPN